MADLDSLFDRMGVLGSGVGRVLKGVFGSRNQRYLKRIKALVQEINAKASWAEGLDQAAMRERTEAWRKEVREQGRSLDELVPEAFAMVREAATRTLGLRPYDVQLVGGIVLHRGSIAEMATGEGKTLVATMPAYLNALAGSVYVVTVNDYLARRDASWMQPVFEYLGLKVGSIQSSMAPAERHPIYACDIVYGTNNEFGFDYLRDNMKSRLEDQVQKNLDYAIIDEVDSILIDEARTPLIISGPAVGDAEKFRVGMNACRKLKVDEHFEVKEKEKQALLSEEGIVAAQKLLGIEDFYSSAEHMEWPHILEQCLRSLHLYKRDVDYVVKDGEIVIVDEFTGRLMPGRRWSDGLHQSIEAKEGLRPKAENQTLATITFQNYFRLFNKLSGMTGTALTEAGEFAKIYDLDVVVIPTNRPIRRDDQADVVYLTEKDKWKAISDEIERAHESGQPILVGTTSIEKSEHLSGMLNRRGVRHTVLNAKFHEKEAEIVAQAGSKGAVTVATNMAGRGTDIVLGGNLENLLATEAGKRGLDPNDPEDEEKIQAIREELARKIEKDKQDVLSAGGLYVLGTERHEARRIDNQLRGRSGRQGDPGYSRFYLSLDDDLLRIFYRDWVKNFLAKAGMGEGEPVESTMVSRAIQRAQKKVESRNFEIRKSLLEYDEVMDKQRKLIYEHRQAALESDGLRERILEMFVEVIHDAVTRYGGDGRDVLPDYEALARWGNRKWGFSGGAEALQGLTPETLAAPLIEDAHQAYEKRIQELGEDSMEHLERFLMLNAIDSKWKDHLYTMDALKSGIGLRSYAQIDPKNEYKREGLERFEELLFSIADEVTNYILRVQIRREDESRLGRAYAGQQAAHPDAGSSGTGSPSRRARPVVAVGYEGASRTSGGADPFGGYSRTRQTLENASQPQGAGNSGPRQPKVARNAPCPCGSGKKYKQCHGKSA